MSQSSVGIECRNRVSESSVGIECRNRVSESSVGIECRYRVAISSGGIEWRYRVAVSSAGRNSDLVLLLQTTKLPECVDDEHGLLLKDQSENPY